MADGNKDDREREGLLTTIRARRKWYLSVYCLQILGWLILVVFNAVTDVKSTDTVTQRIQDAAVIMFIIAQGTLISTVLLIDVVFDGCRYIIKKGAEFMGLLFDNLENKFVVRGRKQGIEQGLKQGMEQGLKQGMEQGVKQGVKQGEKQGQERANAHWNTWIADNPEIRELVESGKVRIPPELQSKETPDDQE